MAVIEKNGDVRVELEDDLTITVYMGDLEFGRLNPILAWFISQCMLDDPSWFAGALRTVADRARERIFKGG